MKPLRGLFVTGTDTGVGKTVVSCGILRALLASGHRPGALKPVATGAQPGPDGVGLVSEDGRSLQEALGAGAAESEIVPFLFQAALAPTVASRLEGKSLSFEAVLSAVRARIDAWHEAGKDLVVVEGVGGVMCPLAGQATVLDLAVALDFPVVLVARRRLGTLNQVLLSTSAMAGADLRLAGLVLNASEPIDDPVCDATNATELGRFLPSVPLLAQLDFGGGHLGAGLTHVDWFELSAPPR